MTTRGGEATLSPPSYARLGEVFAGKYRIERVLGRGGMGIVVAASHVKLRQPVAIKFLLPSSLATPQLATRLLREARAAAALKGEHVARVFDVDVMDGAPYIVMEHLEGQTLASLLEVNGPLAPALTADYALEACEALVEAHALGIVHRDLKPSNLFLARGLGGRETLRVLDFGISKALDGDRGDSTFGFSKPPYGDREASTYTGTDSHTLVGSPPYVSPEQLIRPREVDARSDIWSLGVVLYQCLSGRLPFQGEALSGLWDAILREPMPAFRGGESVVSSELERIVRRCLEKDPALRYPDVRELASELAPLGSARARASLEVIDGLASAPVVRHDVDEVDERVPSRGAEATLTDAPTTREPTPNAISVSSRSRWSSRAGVIVAVAAALGFGTFFVLGSERGRELPRGPVVTSPERAGALEYSSNPESRSVPSVDLPRASIPVSVESAPTPVATGSVARKPAIRREVAVAEAAPAAAPSSSESAPVDVLGRAEDLLGKGQISEACAVGQVAAATAPDSPRVLEFLGRCYMRLGSAEQARSYYRKYLEVAPSAPNAAFVRAMLEPRER